MKKLAVLAGLSGITLTILWFALAGGGLAERRTAVGANASVAPRTPDPVELPGQQRREVPTTELEIAVDPAGEATGTNGPPFTGVEGHCRLADNSPAQQARLRLWAGRLSLDGPADEHQVYINGTVFLGDGSDARLVRCDANGNLRVELAPGAYLIESVDPQLATVTPIVADVRPARTTTLDITLMPTRQITGLVLDADGDPVEDATVLIEPSLRTLMAAASDQGLAGFHTLRLTTDDDGRFAVALPDRDSLIVAFRKDVGHCILRRVDLGAASPLRLTLSRYERIKLQVVSAITGDPIPDLHLQCSECLLPPEFAPTFHLASTDDEGRVTLLARSHQLLISGMGTEVEPFNTFIDRRIDPGPQYRIPLLPANAQVLRVVEGDQARPILGAEVRFVMARQDAPRDPEWENHLDEVPLSDDWTPEGYVRRTAFTDERGIAEPGDTAGLNLRSVYFQVRYRDYAQVHGSVDLTGSLEPHTVPLRPAASLVVHLGQPDRITDETTIELSNGLIGIWGVSIRFVNGVPTIEDPMLRVLGIDRIIHGDRTAVRIDGLVPSECYNLKMQHPDVQSGQFFLEPGENIVRLDPARNASIRFTIAPQALPPDTRVALRYKTDSIDTWTDMASRWLDANCGSPLGFDGVTPGRYLLLADPPGMSAMVLQDDIVVTTPGLIDLGQLTPPPAEEGD